jgi:membrane dipeptidase
MIERDSASTLHRCGCAPSFSLASLGLTAGMTRRNWIRGVGAALAFGLTGCATVSEKHVVAANDLARENASVDLHAHPGFFKTSPLTMDKQVDRMAQGHVKLVLFAAVADGPLIGRRPSGGLYATREPKPGELPTATWWQVDQVRSRIAKGTLKVVETPDALAALMRDGGTGAMLAAEGGDFLEGKLERVAEAKARGLRSIQLVHYRVNELGDIQTEPPRHGGLTPFGLDVIREMNRLGLVVDLAHLTQDGVKQAVGVAKKPVILSHTVLETPFPRSISRAHAQLVKDNGGVIGIFPVNSGYQGFSGYVTHIERMIDAVGADHVGIGTDMDGISPPAFVSYDDYAQWPSIGAALLAKGRSPQDVAKVTGGNFRRVFEEVAAA